MDKPKQKQSFWLRAVNRYDRWTDEHPKTTFGVTFGVLAVLIGVSVALSFLVPTDGSITSMWWILPLVFVSSLAGSASVFLPAPSLTVACIALTQLTFLSFDALVVVTVGAVGSAIGELTAYGVGFGSNKFVKRSRYYKKIYGWVHRHGGPVIGLFAFLPLPTLDLAGIAAGSMRMSIIKFMIWMTGGKMFKFILLAYLCITLYDWAIQPPQSWIWTLLGLEQPES